MYSMLGKLMWGGNLVRFINPLKFSWFRYTGMVTLNEVNRVQLHQAIHATYMAHYRILPVFHTYTVET